MDEQTTEVLRTTWETPETCEYCGEHLALEWSFCLECGKVTPWAEAEIFE